MPTRLVEVDNLKYPPTVLLNVQSVAELAPAEAAAQIRFPEPSVCRKFPETIVEGHVYVCPLNLVVPTTERFFPTFKSFPVLRMPCAVEEPMTQRLLKVA